MKHWLSRWLKGPAIAPTKPSLATVAGISAVARGFNVSIFFGVGSVVLVVFGLGQFADAVNLITTTLLVVVAGSMQLFLVRGWVRLSSAVVLSLLFAGVYFSMVRFGSITIAQSSLACIPLIYCVVILGEGAGLVLLLLSVATSGWITWALTAGVLQPAAQTIPGVQWLILSMGFWVAYRMAVLIKRHLVDASQRVNSAQQALLEERETSNARVLKALQELERQRHVIDQHAIVSTIDVRGVMTYGNQKFVEISGYQPHEFLGKSVPIMQADLYGFDFFQGIAEDVAAGKIWRSEMCSRAKNGSLYWTDTTVTALLNSDGSFREYITVSSDITQRHHAVELAHAASRAKSEFLANVSHEIRTPMNGVVGMVDILRATPLTREQQRMVSTIHDSSIALLQILNDILDFSKIEADKMEIEWVPTHLPELVEGVAQLMVSISVGKEIDLTVLIEPDLPEWVHLDPTRVRQVLYNLLGNALKFTPGSAQLRGNVRLHVRAASHAQTQGEPMLEFSVVDNGIGMSPEMVERLFEAFSQADVSTARKYGGTGLGLTISRRLVEMMHGRILVQSALGQGSLFTVLIPFQAVAVQGQPVWTPALEGVQVLLVSADADAARVLPGHLQTTGAEVSCVSRLSQAQRWLSQVSGPAVLVLDVDQYGSDSLETWRQAGTERGVVCLVRQNQSSQPGHSVTVCARPLQMGELYRGIAMACGRLLVPTMTASSSVVADATPAVAPSVEIARAQGRLILLVEDNETNREVMQEQLRILGYAAECAADGATALHMWMHGEYALMLTDCHMPTMDGFALTEAIRRVETAQEHMPIIAVTANALEGEQSHCLDRGMDDYLTKPLRLNALGAMLAKWLPQEGVRDSTPPQWDSQALGRMVGDNPTMHRRLLDRFVITTTEQMAEFASLRDAGDLQALGALGHKLKSAARTVGAMRLGALCYTLEMQAREGQLDPVLRQVDAITQEFAAVLPYLQGA